MEVTMRLTFGRSLTILGALGSFAAAAPAYAGCADNAAAKPAAWQGDGNGFQRQGEFNAFSIVGMWSVQFFVGTQMIDFGYAQWHSDGTEIMNSGGRAPVTQNFCLGVWAQTGHAKYKLNHWALSYDTSGRLNARVNIREEVTVEDDGQMYSGPFTIDVYDPTNGTNLQHVAGRVTGKRMTVNSGF
jgi:hypothetical protein